MTNNYNFIAHMPFTRSVLCFVLLLLHVASAQQTCLPGWDCWVQSQTILINDHTITLNQSTLVIKQATCTNISIGQTKSSIPATNAILVNFDNTELNCAADWTYTTSSNGINSGTLAVIATGIDVTVDITTITDPTNYGLVKDVQASCDMQVPSTISITFYNNTNTIPLSFQTELQEYFSTQIADVGCSQVENQTTSGLFNFFNGGAQWAAETISYIQPPQPPMSPPSTNNSVNFTNNPFLGLVNYVVNDVLSPNGSLPINTVVNSLTNNTGSFAYDLSGLANVSAIFQPGGFLEPVLVFGSFAQLSYTLQKINVTGLNTWELIDFGEAINSNTLATKTVLNNLVIELELLMNVTFLDPAAQGGSIVQPAVFRTTLNDNTLQTDATLTISTEILSLLFPSQLLQPGCIGQSLVYLNINDLNMTFDMEDSTVTGLPDQITTPNQELMDTMFSSFLQSFEPVGDLIMYSFLWAVPGFMMQGNMAWGTLINKTLSSVPCPSPTFDGATVNRVATLYAYVGAVAVFFLIVLISYIVIRLREANEYEDTPIGETYKLNSEGASENAPLLRQYKTHALLHNTAIPFVIRYGVVFLILGNAALFVASNSSLGASVYLVARTSEGSTTFPSLFNFSLINSIRDMWNAKVYALSILIALFSGVWPYTKLVLLFFCWCSSVKILNIQRRGRILIMLDAMGKWSLIDSFVLILMMVAFHFKLAPPVTEYTPAGSISFEAYVEPHFGFYSFLIATMLSLVLTHLVIKLHDISLVDVEKENRMDNSREALWTHAAGHGNKNRAAYILAIVVSLLVASFVLIILGITIQSFEFDFKGAFGVLLKFLNENHSLTFSVISLGQQFPGSSIEPDNLGTRFIQVSFFIFAIAMPIMYLVCLLILWMVPLTYRFQSRLLTLTATIHAWSALEVFVISIIAALLELQQFAQFIVGDRCDVINKLLASYASELLHGDNKCFDVKASLRTGCWVLFAACAIYVVVGGLVVKGCHNALKKRLDSKPIGYVN